MKHKSTSVPKRPDPRALKTLAQVQTAFLALLQRRSYDRIRVSDITRKARVGRATFYAHFDSKDALLAAELRRVVAPMLVRAGTAGCPINAAHLFAHLLAAREVFRSLMTGRSRESSERIVQDVLEARIVELLPGVGTTSSTFVPRFVAGTLVTLAVWALDQPSPPSATALQQTFGELVRGALAPA